LRGARAVKLVNTRNISRADAILQTHAALRRKLSAEQVNALHDAEAMQNDDVQLGVHQLVKLAKGMAYKSRGCRVRRSGTCDAIRVIASLQMMFETAFMRAFSNVHCSMLADEIVV
jgi:hypothetical protein